MAPATVSAGRVWTNRPKEPSCMVSVPLRLALAFREAARGAARKRPYSGKYCAKRFERVPAPAFEGLFTSLGGLQGRATEIGPSWSRHIPAVATSFDRCGIASGTRE